ncbi:MAG: T9SS type A sorting domain-containing protein [Bacteroidales bacterium]
MKKQITFFARYFGLKFSALLFALLFLSGQSFGQILLEDNFTGLTVGNLAGQSGWAKFGSGPEVSVGNTTVLTYPNYNGGDAEYVIMPTASATTSKVSKALTSTPAPGSNTFYYSLLLRLTATSATSTHYFITLGDPLTGTNYFARLFAKTNGTGFNIGISKLSNTPTYGSTVLNLNQTYLIVVRYDFVAGTTNDPVFVWVNPAINSEPSTAIAEATISSGTDAAPATIGNFHWHNRGLTNPTGSFDGVRVAYGSSSSIAWTNLAASTGSAVTPTVTTGTTTGVTQATANCAGNVTSDGGASITTRGICYGTSANPDTLGTKVSVSGTTGAFTANLVSLALATTYHYRAYAANSVGLAYGANSSFTTTSGAVVPTVIAPTAVTITDNSAILGGNITLDGGSAILFRGTVWNTTTGVSISDNYLAEGGTATGVFSHSRTLLPAKTQIFYKAFATNAIGTALSAENSFFTLAVKPIAHVTGFTATATAYTQIDLSWTPVLADGYLIIKKQGATAPTGIPLDATGYAIGATLGDGTIAADVSTPSAQITGLSPMTQYMFTIIPYNYDGINYQTYSYYTNLPIPSAGDTTLTPPATVFTWSATTASALYTLATNWTPARTTPAANDILQFTDGLIDTVTGVVAETVGQIIVTNNTTVNLQAASSGITYNIGGYTGTDLIVNSGSQLNIIGSNLFNIKLLTSATASISGNMTFFDAAHRIDATDANGIIFETGSSLTQRGVATSYNIFTSTGTASAVVFKTGSTFIQMTGANPFALSSPASKVIFEDGSLFKFQLASGQPSLSGRTYANLEINCPGNTGLSAMTGSTLNVGNLIVTDVSGSVGVNLTGIINIKGDISVASGKILNFTPATSGGSINLNGTAAQTISGSGIFKTGKFANLVINNTNGINVNDSLTISGSLTFTNGNLNLGANIKLDSTAVIAGTPSTTSMIVPNSFKVFKAFNPLASTFNFTFPIGEISPAINYLPVALSFTSVTNTANNYIGLKVVNTKNINDLSATNYLNKYWEIEQSGISSFTCDANFQYASTDVAGNEGLILCKNFSALPIEVFAAANTTLHQLTASAFTQFGAFGGGEDLSITPTISTPTPGSLSGFTTNPGTPSTSQTFTVGGIHLTNDLVINAPANYEIREYGVGSFGTSVTFSPFASLGNNPPSPGGTPVGNPASSGSVSSKTIEVRIAATALVGTPSGTIICSSIGASAQYVAVSGTVTSAPIINVSGSLTAFANTAINTTSAEQSYTIEGSNLTANILIAPPSGFEISTSTGVGFTATNPITLIHTAGTVTPTIIYVRFAPTLLQAYSGNITHTSGALLTNLAVSGTGVVAEPSNHATSFVVSTGIPSHTVVNLSWTDAVGGTAPDGYLIKGSTVGFSAISNPIDGTPETDGGLVKNIAQGIGSYQFTGLATSTNYYFRIFPYTNSGNIIDYKTSAIIPEDSASTAPQPIITYTWNVASGKWNVATSWTPNRDFPATNDILVFDGNTQSAPVVTLDFTSPQSIGTLRIINNANVSFATSDAARILNVGYTAFTSPQFEITSGAALTVSATSAFTLNLPSGYFASISGNVSLLNAAHKLTAATAAGITFNSGAVFTAGTLLSGNPLGTTTANSVVFANGSTYIYEAGSNPFVLTQPSSVVVFQTGSLYKHKSSGTPSFSGRTYADFELDAPGLVVSVTASAASNINNLIITNGTFNYNATGTPGHSIKGNITIAAGQTLGFLPTSAATINLNGTSAQTISGAGTLTIGPNANFVVNNSVIADRNITFGGSLTINSGKSLVINSNKNMTVNGTLTNNAGTTGLIISADGSGNASLIHSTAGVNASVDRFIPHYFQDEFHMLGSPVVAQAIAPQFNELDGFYLWNEAIGDWIEYANANFAAANNGGTNFVPGKGYAVSYPFQTMKTFSGVLNQGSIAVPMTVTTGLTYSGFNFVANPYPSSINWDAASGWTRDVLEDAGGAQNAMWIWNAMYGNYGTYISNGGVGSGTNDVSNNIALSQGFWVKAAIPGNLNMDNGIRIHSSQAFLKSSATVTDMLRLKVNSSVNSFSDEILVKFGNAFNQNGAEKMFSITAKAPSLYTTKLNKNWSINNLTNVTDNSIIPLGFKAGENGNYTIHATDLTSFVTPTYVYLKDLKLNSITDLNQNPDYTFAATTNDIEMRFQLIFALSPLAISNQQIQHTGIYSFNNTIFINSNESINSISVYNTFGQLIKSIENADANTIISMKDNATGYYIVKVVSDKNVYSEKVLVK